MTGHFPQKDDALAMQQAEALANITQGIPVAGLEDPDSISGGMNDPTPTPGQLQGYILKLQSDYDVLAMRVDALEKAAAPVSPTEWNPAIANPPTDEVQP